MHPRLSVVILGALLMACQDTATGSTAQPGSGDSVGPPRMSVAELRERLHTEFPTQYAQWLAASVTPEAIGTLLLMDDAPVNIQRAGLLYTLYAGREFAPVFVDGQGGLTHRVQPVIATILDADTHALPVPQFYTPTLAQALSAYEEFGAVMSDVGPLMLTRADLNAIDDLLSSERIASAADPVDAMMRALFEGEPSQSPLPELATSHAARVRAARALAGASAVTEALLMDRVLDYAFAQRHFNLFTFDEEPSEEEGQRIVAERLTATFQALADASDATAAQTVLDALPPTLPQYALLMPAAARYREIVAQGGWNEIDGLTLRRGNRHVKVAALKERLQMEGYYTGPIDETFDQALKDAVELYERTHQMEVDGETDRTFWASLNIPAEERLAQVEITMQRWRESRIGDDPYYILVNIPDFHAEVWRNGVRDMRFRIVVGNTQRVCDPRARRMRYANATPLQSAYMTYLVLNPYWNVPRRILEEELIPNLLEDGNYFEENGIEQGEDGTVRLRPGPSNPLGKVKFIFPNPHATYLHDTNRRNYFQFPVRAFSHGCMRVHEPENLMEYLLTQDGQYDERAIERTFEHGREEPRYLTTPVPVHVEYYVVRVDDDGYVNFNSDIYKYDRDRLRPEEARNERCEPDARPGMRLVLSEDGRPMVQDAEGNLIDPSATDVEEVIPAADAAGPAAGDYGP